MSRNIPLNQIKPNLSQPRQHFDEESLRELARSIEDIGQQSPILVRPNGDDSFEIVYGERRWRACKLAGLDTIRAEIREMDDKEAFVNSLVENEQRDDISPIETARAIKVIIDEQGLTQTGAAEKVARSRTWVAQKLRLLNLPSGVQEMMTGGDSSLTEGHARQLLKLQTAKKDDQVNRLAERVASEGWSVARLQSEVDIVIIGNGPEPAEEVSDDLDVEDIVRLAFFAGVQACVARHIALPENQFVSRDTSGL